MDKEREINNEGLNNLSDEQLMESIREINANHLKNIAYISYANILSNKISILDKIKNEETLVRQLEKEEEKFGNILDIISSKIRKLNILNDVESQDKDESEYYKELRKEIVKLIRGLSAYSTEISISGEISGDFIYKDSVKAQIIKIPNINYSDFYNNVSTFLMQDTNLLKEKVMDITSVIPVRITKAKYYDIISKTLKRSLSNSNKEGVETIIRRYKAVFNGSLVSEYGLFFNRYFLVSQECKNFDFSKISIDKLKELYQKTINIISEIGKVANILMNLGVLTNEMIIINILKKYILKDDIQNVFKDIRNLVERYQEDNSQRNKSHVLEEINKFIKRIESEFNDNNNRLQELSVESFRRKLEIDSSVKSELLLTQQVLAYLSDYALEKEDITLSTEYVITDNDFLEHSINALIQYLDRNIKDMNVLQRRARMRRLLSLTDFPFDSPDEFFDYLSNSIEMTTDEIERFAIINKISELMQNYN